MRDYNKGEKKDRKFQNSSAKGGKNSALGKRPQNPHLKSTYDQIRRKRTKRPRRNKAKGKKCPAGKRGNRKKRCLKQKGTVQRGKIGRGETGSEDRKGERSGASRNLRQRVR